MANSSTIRLRNEIYANKVGKGISPSSKSQEKKFPVAMSLIIFFVFVVVGSAVFQFIKPHLF